MRESNQIEIVSVGGEGPVGRVNAQLRSLILSRERTIPGSRGFGLSGDFVDLPSYEAASEFAVELEEKVDAFIPEIDIAEVHTEMNINGINRTQVFVEWRDGYDNRD